MNTPGPPSNPDKVSCIYADNPGIYPEDISRLGELIKHDVPLLNVCGSLDFVLEKNTKVIENIYQQGGGRITIMIKEGTGHHPHSLIDPKPIADFIEQHVQPSTAARPEFVDDTFTKSYYYSIENSYIYLPKEDTYATCRGPQFTPCYDRYDKTASRRLESPAWRCSCRRLRLPGSLGSSGRTASAGMPPPLIWPCWPRVTTSWRLRSLGGGPQSGRVGRRL